MRIHRRSRADRFTVLGNDLLQNADLSWGARGLLAYLLSLPPQWRISVRHLVDQAPDGQTRLCRLTRELEDAGYLRIQLRRDAAGRIAEHCWEVTDEPHRWPENPGPDCDYPHAENPHTVNRAPINKGSRQYGSKKTPLEPPLQGGRAWGRTSCSGEDRSTEDLTPSTVSVSIESEPEKDVSRRSAAKTAQEGASGAADEETYPEAFEDAWKAYGRRGSKKPAFRAWRRVVRRNPRLDLLDAIRQYLTLYGQLGKDQKFLRHFSTWLNQDGWDDIEVMRDEVSGSSRPTTTKPNRPDYTPSRNWMDDYPEVTR